MADTAQKFREEMVNLLEGLKKTNVPFGRGKVSYDYQKGFNDCQWEYYKMINLLLEKLQNPVH